MPTPLEVFCCYAREDQEMLADLKRHLALLRRQGLITIWSDTNINAGVEWEKELHQHLEIADIILLLISPNFIASDYCYSTEMSKAIQRHNKGDATVVPILLRPTLWQNAPFAKLQMVPTNAKPVTSWSDRDDALHDIAMQISQTVSKLHTMQEGRQPLSDHRRQTGAIIQTFDTFWYLPDIRAWSKSRITMMFVRDTGKLIVRDNLLEFQGKKGAIVIRHIKSISFGKQAPDTVNNYVKVIYGDDAEPSTAFFADARSLGWGGVRGGTEMIRDTLQQVYFKDR